MMQSAISVRGRIGFVTWVVGVYSFLLLFVAQLGNAIAPWLNTLVLWLLTPIVGFFVIGRRGLKLTKWPKELYWFGALGILCFISSVNVISWSLFMRHWQALAANFFLMIIFFTAISTQKQFYFILRMVLLSLATIVIYSLLFHSSSSDITVDYYRFEGLSGNANGIANVSRLGFLLALIELHRRIGLFSRLILYALLIVFFYSILISASRGNLLNLTSAVFVYGLLYHIRGRRLLFTLLVALLAGGLIWTLLINFLDDFYIYERLVITQQKTDGIEGETRVKLYKMAWQTFVDNYFLGIGLNQFGYYSGGKGTHSDLLDMALHTGIVGGLVYLRIYISIGKTLVFGLRKAYKNLRKTNADIGIMTIIFFSEMIYGVTNTNWFQQLQIIILTLLIIYSKRRYNWFQENNERQMLTKPVIHARTI